MVFDFWGDRDFFGDADDPFCAGRDGEKYFGNRDFGSRGVDDFLGEISEKSGKIWKTRGVGAWNFDFFDADFWVVRGNFWFGEWVFYHRAFSHIFAESGVENRRNDHDFGGFLELDRGRGSCFVRFDFVELGRADRDWLGDWSVFWCEICTQKRSRTRPACDFDFGGDRCRNFIFLKMIFLGVGSSIGDAEAEFADAEEFLRKNGVKICQKSKIFRSPPLAPPAKNEFSNAVWRIEFDGTARELLKICKRAEAEAGRDFSASRWSDRELDLDILIFRDEKIDDEDLKIPHPGIFERKFVLEPLAEVAGVDFEISGAGKIRNLIQKIEK